MIEKINNEKAFFELFTDSKSYKACYTFPVSEGAYIYATNGWLIVRVSKALIANTYPESKSLSFSSFGFFNKQPNTKPLTREDLVASLSQVELIDEKRVVEEKECSHCDGEGIVEWEFDDYTKEDDCPYCEGSGTVEAKEEPTGRKIANPEGLVYLVESSFRYHAIERLLKAMDYLHIETATVHSHVFYKGKAIRVVLTEGVDVAVSRAVE